jgi:DNA invertase Pin-like site-specific DNA recombinase
MIAAIYARKSTEQHGLADDEKSVARQIDHARQYAARKGGRSMSAACSSTMASAAPSLRTGRGTCASSMR